jgi:hypothetical protein
MDASKPKAEGQKTNSPSRLANGKPDVWPEGYFDRAFGFWQGPFPEIEDPPPEPLAPIDSWD